MAKTSTKNTTESKETKPKKEATKETQKKAPVEAKASVAAPKKTKTAAPKAKKVEGAKKGRVGGLACKIQNCKREYRSKGYCSPHYRKWRHGEYGVARYKTCSDSACQK